jgi:cell division protein FtsB
VRNKRVLVILLAFALVMTLLTVFGENGLLHSLRLKRELERLGEANESIRLENADLLEDIEHLRDHEGYLELQAHRQGLVREGEIVFQFSKDH